MIKKLILSAGLCLSLMGTASAQVYNGSALADFWESSYQSKTDVVCIGDSNQLFAGHGWDEGWGLALKNVFTLYATGIHSSGENFGNGSGVGHISSTISTLSGGQYTYGSANPLLNNYLDGDCRPLNYLYRESGTVSGSFSTGMVVNTHSSFGPNPDLRFHVTYALFPNGNGSFRPTVRLEYPPYTNITGYAVSTLSNNYGIAREILEVPGSSYNGSLGFRFARAGQNELTGPFLAYYTRCEILKYQTGSSLHTLYANGGQSLWDMGTSLANFSDESLTLYFTEVRKLGSGKVLVRINSALNDRNENQPSLIHGYTPGSSGVAYEDNCQFIINRIQSIWLLNGWPATSLHFLITPSHSPSTPEDIFMTSYRLAAKRVSDNNPRTAVYDFSHITESEMMANQWYTNSTDRNHLSLIGFQSLATIELNGLIVASYCPADINQDYSFDSDDISIFFALWESGNMDFDNDEDTDSDDIAAFFAAWELGGC